MLLKANTFSPIEAAMSNGVFGRVVVAQRSLYRGAKFDLHRSTCWLTGKKQRYRKVRTGTFAINFPAPIFLAKQNTLLRGTLSPRKPMPERTLAMFLGTKANSKDTVVQEKGSNPQNYF